MAQKLASKDLLKKRSLRATSTRIGVLNVIQSHKGATPYSQLKNALADTDRITLYRTLNTLLEKGIIHNAPSNNEETYYAMCGDTCSDKAHVHNHVHFQCTDCETITCQHLAKDVSIQLPNFEIENVNILLTGKCSECFAELG